MRIDWSLQQFLQRMNFIGQAYSSTLYKPKTEKLIKYINFADSQQRIIYELKWTSL